MEKIIFLFIYITYSTFAFGADDYPEICGGSPACSSICYSGGSEGSSAFSLNYLIPVSQTFSCANQNISSRVVENFVGDGNYNNYVSLDVYSALESSFNPASALAFWGQDIINNHSCDGFVKYIGYTISTFTNCDGYVTKSLRVYWAWFSPHLMLSRTVDSQNNWSFVFKHALYSGQCGDYTFSIEDVSPFGGRLAKYTVFSPSSWWPDQYNGFESVLPVPNEFNYNELFDGILNDNKYTLEYYHPTLTGKCVAVYDFNHYVIRPGCSSPSTESSPGTWSFQLSYRDSFGILKSVTSSNNITWELWSSPSAQSANGEIPSTQIKTWSNANSRIDISQSDFLDDPIIYEVNGESYQGVQYWYLTVVYQGDVSVLRIYGSNPPCRSIDFDGSGVRSSGKGAHESGHGVRFRGGGGFVYTR